MMAIKVKKKNNKKESKQEHKANRRKTYAHLIDALQTMASEKQKRKQATRH